MFVAFGVLACEVPARADCLADSPLAPTQDFLLDGPWSMPPVPGTLWWHVPHSAYLHAQEHAATDAEASFEHRASSDEYCQLSPIDEDLQVPVVVAWLPLFKMAPPAHRLLIWSARTFVHRTTPR